MQKAHFGMVGLGTMGRNFLLNIAEKGIRGVGYDLDASKRDLLLSEGSGLPVEAGSSLEDFLDRLESPRNIMLLVPAGPIVDSVISQLSPHLQKDDLIIDGGNSHFTDTDRRDRELAEKGIGFMGIGVSGGEEGARHGASIMPGGARMFYDRVERTLQAVSAKVNGEPCVAYMGQRSAGHFVKMVHNGIEYALMQILAEAYDFMRRILHMNYREMSDTFAQWNDAELNSFLVEITGEVLRKVDADTGKPLVEMVLDKAAQKGTGKWTSQAAMDLGVPIPTIDSAVAMRQISAQKEIRALIAKRFSAEDHIEPTQMSSHGEAVGSERQSDFQAGLTPLEVETPASLHLEPGRRVEAVESVADTDGDGRLSGQERDAALAKLQNALHCSFVTAYAQGMSMLQAAAAEFDYGLDLAEICRIWRGGCIIRSSMLEEMMRAYTEDPRLPNLMLHREFAESLERNKSDWRSVTESFSRARIPSMCLSSTLSYFDAFCSERLPANLIQAQRDFFGAHTYQRTDKEGVFHTPNWKED